MIMLGGLMDSSHCIRYRLQQSSSRDRHIVVNTFSLATTSSSLRSAARESCSHDDNQAHLSLPLWRLRSLNAGSERRQQRDNSRS